MSAERTHRTKPSTPNADAARELTKSIKRLRKTIEPRRAALRGRKEKLAALYAQSRGSITALIERGNVTANEKLLFENIRQLLRTVEGLALYCMQIDERNGQASLMAADGYAAHLETDAKLAALEAKVEKLAAKVSAKASAKAKKKKNAAPAVGTERAPSPKSIAAATKKEAAIAAMTAMVDALMTTLQ